MGFFPPIRVECLFPAQDDSGIDWEKLGMERNLEMKPETMSIYTINGTRPCIFDEMEYTVIYLGGDVFLATYNEDDFTQLVNSYYDSFKIGEEIKVDDK